jgi:hypothetical protein
MPATVFLAGFELAFTFGSTKCLAALLGFPSGITYIKPCFWCDGVDFALLALAAAWLVRDLTSTSGPHVCLAPALMPLSHHFETIPNWDDWGLPVKERVSWSTRFEKNRRLS